MKVAVPIPRQAGLPAWLRGLPAWLRGLPAWLLALLVTSPFLDHALSAQLPLATGTREEAADEQESGESQAERQARVVAVPAEHRSARATMRTFLEAFAGGDLAAAVACLDLSEIPQGIRELRGRELATQLKAGVIDRVERVEFGSIPNAGEQPYVFAPEVVIAPNALGEWLFTADTVAAIPRLVERYADRDLVEGVVAAPPTPAMWLRAHVPEQLRGGGFLLEYWQWLGLAALIFLGMVLDRTLVAILEYVVGRRLRRQLVRLDGELVRVSLRPLGLVAVALVWWIGLGWLGLPERPLLVLMLAVKFVAAFALVWWSYRTVDVLAGLLAARAAGTDTRYDDLLVPLVRKSAKVFIAAFGIIFVADTLDLPIASLITGLGLGGVAFALAGQDVVKNLFGSVTVLIDRPFHVGDWVVTQGLEGTVEEVGFRSTRIRTFYNSLITLPNSTLINASVDNYGARRYRRWKTVVALTYDTPPEKVDAFCEGIRELVRHHPYTRKDYFHVYFNEFGAASLDVLLYVFFETPDWGTELRERHRLGVDILRLAARLGVEFAFPTQTLYLKRPDDDGDAAQAALTYAGELEGELGRSRSEARRLVDDVLGDEIPPPVGFGAEVEPGGEAEESREP